MRTFLTDNCQIAWEKINALEELVVKLEYEIDDKQEAFSIDNAQLNLNKDCAEITFKTDPLQTQKR